jgi:hypothetical protein
MLAEGRRESLVATRKAPVPVIDDSSEEVIGIAAVAAPVFTAPGASKAYRAASRRISIAIVIIGGISIAAAGVDHRSAPVAGIATAPYP